MKKRKHMSQFRLQQYNRSPIVLVLNNTIHCNYNHESINDLITAKFSMSCHRDFDQIWKKNFRMGLKTR